MALLLAAVGFAAAVLWNLMAGSAIGAVALFVALRPLFIEQRNQIRPRTRNSGLRAVADRQEPQ